jgi:hypothetical protein
VVKSFHMKSRESFFGDSGVISWVQKDVRSEFISRSARMRTRLRKMRYLTVDKYTIVLFPTFLSFVRLIKFVSSYILSCRIYGVYLP